MSKILAYRMPQINGSGQKRSRLIAVIVTKDDDFVLLHAQDAQGPRIILVRVGNVSNARLIEIFEQLWPSVVVALEAGDRLIEFSDGRRLK